MLRNFCVGVAMIALFSASAVAQPEDPDIVVVGERLEQVTREYVTALAAPSVREDQLARWDERVCVGVAGLSASDGQMNLAGACTEHACVRERNLVPAR